MVTLQVTFRIDDGKDHVITYNPKKNGKKPQNVPLSKKEEFGKRISQRKEGFGKQQIQSGEGFKKQIFQFANELTNIVNITKKSFCDPSDEDGDVVEIDSGSDVECMPDSGCQGDDSCYIVEPEPGNLEFQAVEDNIVIIDAIKQEPVIEPEVDPLSSEVLVKSEPVESVEIKTENIYGFTLADHCEKQLPKGQGIPLFSCDLCTYTSKYSHVIGHHKRRVHNVKGKSKLSTYRNQSEATNEFGRLLKCNLCPYTTKLAAVLGSHKLRAHNVRGKKSQEELARKTYSVRSLTPVKENVQEEKKKEEKIEEKENNFEEKKEVKETQKSQFPHYIGVPVVKKCPHCPFKTKFNAALAMHKKLKHYIEPERKVNMDGRYECEYCHKSYSNSGNLSRHMKLCRKRQKRHAGKPKRSCPYCGKTTFIEFQLRRHIENKHPDQWERLKMKKQGTPDNVQQEHLPRMEETTNRVVEKREPLYRNEPTNDKYNCQLCPFQTDDFHILGLHKQIKHAERNKSAQEGRLQCEHCQNSYSNYANLMRHTKQRHINKPKRNCPFCGKTMFFEFTLHRHVERNHPSQWEKLKLKKESTPHSVQQEHLTRMDETANSVVEKRKPLYRNESSVDKYSCQLCPFQTEDFHILGLHKQIKHVKRRKSGQGGVLKCLFCPERYSFRSQMMRHVATKHRGAWLKMERSTEQSNLDFEEEADRKELKRKISSKPKLKFSNTSHYVHQRQCYESSKEVASTSNRSVDSNNSNSSWKDVKEEVVGQSEVARKYCGACDRFYNATYHRYHTCKKFIKCDICSYMSVSAYKVQFHKAKVHMNQGVIKVEDSNENKQRQEKQDRVVKGVARSGDSLQELVKLETASTGHSSVSEMIDDEEYVPSTWKKKKGYLLNKPRKTCKKCKKSFHVSYFRYHRCVKLFKCSCCSYTDSSLKKLRQHRRAYHPNLQNESGPTASNEGHKLNDIKLPYAQPEEEIIVESIENQPNVCEADKNIVYPSQSLGGEMIFCEECNSNHNPNYLWKYVCYKQNIIRCNACSFVSSSRTYMQKHKEKQHSIKKFSAGNTQSCQKLKCQFCPLLFSKVHQLKNHLDMKHVEDTGQAKKKLLQDDLRMKLSQQIKPTWKSVTNNETIFVEDQSRGSQSDDYKASTSTASKDSLMKQKRKKNCRRCRRSYNRDYFPYHRCSMEKHSKREEDKPSSNTASEETQKPSEIKIEVTQPASNIAIEDTQPASNIAIEDTHSPSDITIEDTQPASNIAIEDTHSPSDITIEDTQPASNIAIEDTHSPSDITIEDTQPASNIAIEDTHSPSDITIEYTQPASNIAVEDTHSPSDITIEDAQPASNIAIEDTHSPSDITIEDTQPASNIAIEDTHSPSDITIEDIQPPSISAIEGSQSLSNKTIGEFKPLPVIAKGFTEVLGDRIKCENCKMHFKTSAFQGHNCRPILRCKKCSFRTRIKTQMTLHNKKHLLDDLVVTEESLYECKTCQKKFASRSWFMNHKLCNECKRKPLHQCSLCQKKFSQEKNLELHMLQLHSDNNDKGEDVDERKDNDNESERPCPPV